MPRAGGCETIPLLCAGDVSSAAPSGAAAAWEDDVTDGRMTASSGGRGLMVRVACIVSLLALVLVTMLPGGVNPSASAQDPTPDVACPETAADEQAATARRWFEEGLNGGDFSVLDEILADDFTYHSGALSEMNASELTDTVLAPIRVGFPDVHYTVDESLTGDDVVVLIWSAEGTQTGEFQGYAPSGNAARWTGINVYRFECGRVAEAWAEFDGLGRLRQMGVVGTPVP
jgi:steroid delta-isomerase-like uncharacterized protein